MFLQILKLNDGVEDVISLVPCSKISIERFKIVKCRVANVFGDFPCNFLDLQSPVSNISRVLARIREVNVDKDMTSEQDLLRS